MINGKLKFEKPIQLNLEASVKQNDLFKQINLKSEIKNSINSLDQTNRFGSINQDSSVINSINSNRIDENSSNIKRSKLTEFDKLIEIYLSLQGDLNKKLSSSQLNIEQLLVKSKVLLSEQTSLSEQQSNKRTKRNLNDHYFNVYDEILAPQIDRRKDWRESNVISEIDNQGICGACWAHSTLETIESMAGE